MTPPSPLSPLGGADREMPHEPSRLLVAGDLHADESWFENLVYYAREQRCQAILQLGDLGYWPRIRHYDDFLRSLPRQLEGADLDLYFVEGNHEDLDALFDTDFPQVGPFRKIEERVYHLPRGAQWRWHGLRFVSVGGGYSLDKKLRIPGYDWFERETLSEGELHAILEERGEIDVLVSHDCPARVALELGMLPIAASLSHKRALATIVERMRPALCLHGHLHRTHRTLWEDEESGVRCLVIGLADETQRSANVRIFDLAELAALVGRIRRGVRSVVPCAWATNVLGAMPIPTYEGRRTYFFFADVEPKELMTFGVEAGIQLDDDSTLEVLGHALAYWAIAEEQDLLTLRAFVQDVFDVTLAIYALIRLDRGDRRDALRLRAELHSWLEVRGVEARANVVGTIHERYEAGAVTELDGPRARDFTTAANAAWRFVRKPTLRLAFKDLGFSLLDRGDDAFLYAYRAVENARRFHAGKVSATETKPVWPPLHAALGTSEEQLQPLTDAATSIRHGNTKSAALAAARVNRDATLVLAEDVLRRLAQHEGVSW